MAYFLFIDESGQDHRSSPYEVLGGFVIRDTDLWELIKAVQVIEQDCFGRTYRQGKGEIKAAKFLKVKTFRLAMEHAPIPQPERRRLAKEVLDNGAKANKQRLAALSQAKLDYVKRILELVRQYNCYAFASIIRNLDLLPLHADLLRRDYIYLFERFFYFLEDQQDHSQGIVVFDEKDKTASHLLLSQMEKYFKRTSKGRARSSLIIPEPFFVHSDLTTGIQLVDFIAYIISWNFRTGDLTKAKRPELNELMNSIAVLRYITKRSIGKNSAFQIWSFAIV